MTHRPRLALLIGLLVCAGVASRSVVTHAATVGPPITGLSFYNVGGSSGYDPFTCPSGAPSGCGALLDSDDTGEYQVGFEVPSGNGIDENETVTLTGPNGVDFSNATFEIGWGGITDTDVMSTGGGAPPADINVGCYDSGSSWFLTASHSEDVPGPFETGSYPVPNEGCQHESPATTVKVDGNSVTIMLPTGFEQTVNDTNHNWPAVVQATGVVNPPAGTYQSNQWTVEAGADTEYSPGPVSNMPEFDNARANQDNTTLGVSSPTTPVSDNSGVGVTATVRDLYGNPVPGASVAIEPLGGNATPIDSGAFSTTTTDAGTVTEQFADTVAQAATFEAYLTSQSPTEAFPVEENAPETFTPGPPVAANSFVELGSCTASCTPDTQVSTAGGQADVTVGLADQYGNPDLGDEVVLTPQSQGQFQHGTTQSRNSACPMTPVISGAGCAVSTDELTVQSSGTTTDYTDAAADFTVEDPTAEDVLFSVDDVSSGTALSLVPLGTSATPLTLDFLAGPPVTTSISAASPTVTADGHSSDAVTVSLTDAGGNPVSGLSVALVADAGSHATLNGTPATTQSNGQAHFTISDATVESTALTATYTGTINGSPVSGSVTGSAAVDFVAGATSSTNSTLTATPTSVLDDGVETATVTATLRDGEGHAAAGRVVTLAGSAGTNSLITPEAISVASSGCPTAAPAGTTDCNGQVQFSVSDSAPETVTYTATDQSYGIIVTQVAAVTFTAPPSSVRSTLIATPQTDVADGVTQATVEVTLDDANGNPVIGRAVCLTQTTSTVLSDACATESSVTPSAITAQPNPGSSCVGSVPAPGTTNCEGQATFTVTATAPGTVSYGVIDITDDGPDGALVGPSTTVTFTRAPNEAGESTVTAAPAQALAGAAGVNGTAVVTVQLLTAAGTPVAGHAVALSASSPSAAVTAVASPATGCGGAPSAGTTDCNGVATFTVTDANVETVTFSASDSTGGFNVLQTASVMFLSDETTSATVGASPATVVANDGLTNAGVAQVTVELDAAQPGVDAGDRVSLSQPSGDVARIIPQASSAAAAGCLISAGAGVANCHGSVTFAVSDPSPETVSFSAIDTTTGVLLGQTASVTFTPIAPIIEAISPAAGPLAGGTAIAISGVGLAYPGVAPVITIGGRHATDVRCSSNSRCSAVVPAGVRPEVAAVTVSTSIGTSLVTASGPDHFTYTVGRPVILSLAPNHGSVRGGSTVIIAGRNLQAAKAVSFGATRVVVRRINAAGTRLTVRVPAELRGTVELRVTTPSGTSLTSAHTRFSYRPAVTTAGTPNRKRALRARTD